MSQSKSASTTLSVGVVGVSEKLIKQKQTSESHHNISATLLADIKNLPKYKSIPYLWDTCFLHDQKCIPLASNQLGYILDTIKYLNE